MRIFPLIFTLSVIGLGIGGAVGYWTLNDFPEKVETEHPAPVNSEQKKVASLLREFHPKEAAAILAQHRENFSEHTPNGRKWIALAISTAVELRDKKALIQLYREFPESLERNETAALLLAEYFLQNNEENQYLQVHKKWPTENSKTPERWLVLDANLLEMQGKRSLAMDLLSSQVFSGPKDTHRLVRLAMLSTPESPADAWTYLSEALRKDPDNSDLRMYRAKLLESENRSALALAEYTAALQQDPKNPFMRNQLVDFYVRQQQYPEALKVLVEGFKYPTLDSAWIKAVFWEKVAGPSHIPWNNYLISAGNVKPFIEYMIHLPEDQFWDSTTFQKLRNYSHYLSTQPVSVWLRVFDLLKTNREEDASTLLAVNPFENLYLNPELEVGIRRILNYRLSGSLILEKGLENHEKDYFTDANVISFDALPFLDQLTILAKQEALDTKFILPPEIKNLLKSPLAYVSVLLSQNWNQAALILNTQQVFPEDIPSWVAVKMARALHANLGLSQALQFARRQHQTPDLQLFVAELLIGNQQLSSAFALLKELKNAPGDNGARASLMLSRIYIDQKNYPMAKASIMENANLFAETRGLEGLARIAILEGDPVGAEKIYENIQNSSAEARSFLARKAFSDKDWEKARKLTLSLIQEFPNNQLLRDNLNKINSEIRGSR